jgi:hypothetical protein
MIRSLGLSATLPAAAALLMCAGSVSARTRGTCAPIPKSTIQMNAVTSAVNQSQSLASWASLIYSGGDDGYQDWDKGKDKDKDKWKDKDPRAPIPAPEPSTMLSFGAALLIGGAALYSRRLRRNRK